MAAAGHKDYPSGLVKIFKNLNNSWTQISTAITGDNPGDRFGSSIDITANGSLLAIGSSHSEGNGTDSGQVKVYQTIDERWEQIGNSIKENQIMIILVLL